MGPALGALGGDGRGPSATAARDRLESPLHRPITAIADAIQLGDRAVPPDHDRHLAAEGTPRVTVDAAPAQARRTAPVTTDAAQNAAVNF